MRVHPIMTKGGDLVNVIPNEAIIETLVRANNTKAILDASEKTDRAFLAGAVAVGAKVEIETMLDICQQFQSMHQRNWLRRQSLQQVTSIM